MRFIFLILLCVLLLSCQDKSIVGKNCITCDCEQQGLIKSTINEEFIIYIPTISTPDIDRILQCNISIQHLDVDLSGNKEELTVVSSDLTVLDIDNNVLYHGQSFSYEDTPNSPDTYLHFWDLRLGGEPYYGEYFIDLKLKFDNGGDLTVSNYKMLSVSCQQINDFNFNSENCEDPGCRTVLTLYPPNGSSTEPIPSIWNLCE